MHIAMKTAANGRALINTRRISVAVAVLLATSLLPMARAESDIGPLAEQARQNFKPVTAEQLAAARSELQQRMGELERFLHPSSANGQKWLRYLKWDDLKKELARGQQPELTAMDATIGQLNRDQTGLDLPRFRRVADALQKYRDLVAVSQWENPAELFGQQVDALTQSLTRYRDDPTPANELALGAQLGVLSAIGQSPELVAAVKQEFGKPNAYIDISSKLLAAAAEPINRTEPITDNILGTRIRGDAHTTGSVTISTIPSGKAGILELTSTGRSVSQNVGHNGPAVIRSTGHTDFTATKRVELRDSAFASLPAQAEARTHSDIHSIGKQGGGIGSRMVSRIGWQRAGESKNRADAIASDHAETRIERQFDRDVNKRVQDARKRYEDEYVRPLARRGSAPNDVQFSTSKDALSLKIRQANNRQLSAPADPPASPADHDVTMRVHESAVNNYTAAVLGGATASESEPGQDTKFDVTMPNWLKEVWEERRTEPTADTGQPALEFKPWSLRFRADRPISVDFADGKVTLTLHIDRLQSGNSAPFTRWDVWGTFVPELKDGGVVLRREGDLDARPTGLQGELGSRRAAQRNNLLTEFNARSAEGRGFPNEIEFPQFEPEGALKQAGPLALRQLVSDDGWLTLVWDRASVGADNGPTPADAGG